MLQFKQQEQEANLQSTRGYAVGTQSSHGICACLKDFATRTDMKGKIPDNKDEFDHEAAPALTDCQLQDLVYQATDNTVMLDNYLADNNAALFLHTNHVGSEPAMKALFQAFPISVLAGQNLHNQSTVQDFLVYLRTINPANYNRQYHDYSAASEDNNWIEYSETAAISMCMHHAVPTYVSSVEEYLGVQVHYKFGEHLLLAAVFIGIYFMSVEIGRALEKYKQDGTPRTDYTYQFVDYSTKIQKAVSILGVGGILIVAVLILVNVNMKGGQDKPYWRAIFDSVQSEVLSLQIIGAISVILWLVLVLTFIVIAACIQYEKDCTVVACMMFDICVILGSAHIAITMSVLRGITSSETILLAFLLVLSVGLLQHFSNLSMFVLQIANAFSARLSSRKVALHRFVHAVLSALILYCVYALASTTFASSTVDLIQSQSSNFMFLVGLFFILHGYDIWVETAVHFNTMKNPTDARNFFTKKHYVVGILILLVLLILNLQRYLFLCGKEETHASEDTVCKRPFEYIFGPTANSKQNHFYSG